MLWIWIMIFFLSAYQMTLTNYFLVNPEYFQLDAYTWESDVFRRIALGEVLLGQEELDFDFLAACMVEKQFDLRGVKGEELEDWKVWKKRIEEQKPVEFQKLKNSYAMIFSDKIGRAHV